MAKHTPDWATLYEQAVAMYTHEDALAGHKVHNALFVNAGLVAALGFETADKYIPFICIAGAVVNLFFFVSLRYGRHYLVRRKTTVYALAKKLGPTEPDLALLPSDPPDRWLTTSQVMCFLVFVLFLAWAYAAYVNISG